MQTFLPFRCLALIGLGLIGSSIARAAKKYQLAESILAYDADQEAMILAKQHAIIDQWADSAKAAIKRTNSIVDCIVIATPVSSIIAVLKDIADSIPPEAIIIDTGSVKQSIVDAASGFLAPDRLARFVPCHPVAGAEKSGVLAGRDDLFTDHKIIITPLSCSDAQAVERVKAFWLAMDTQVLSMPATRHDKLLAMTSHLPHLLAFSLVNSLAEVDESLDVFRYAAGGFADFTRIAASDPKMWHDIFLANKAELIKTVQLFKEGLEKFEEAVATEDSEKLLGIMAKAKSARQCFSHRLKRTGSMNKQEYISYRIDPKPGEIKRAGVRGRIQVPGDKSISHRAIIFGAISQGITEIHGFLEGEDNLATLEAFRLLGVVIEGPSQSKVKVHGVGLHGLKAPKDALYLGNSGTSMRLLCGLLAGQAFNTVLTGDASLSKRPMARVIQPLRKMGAEILAKEDNFAPLHITGNPHLQAIDYSLPIASAQVKSCLLLAGLYAQGQTSIRASEVSRNHTELMLQGFGCKTIKTQCSDNSNTISLSPVTSLTGQEVHVPGDISSAAFFMVLASLLPDSELTITKLGINPTRTGIISVLEQMGAHINLANTKEITGEPVADIRITSAPLKAVSITPDLVPKAIDEFPIIFVAAAFAEGTSLIQGIKELRYKESDRIQTMVKGLTALGIKTEEKEDQLTIHGTPVTNTIDMENTQPVVIDACGDHRIAMAFTMAAFISGRSVIIKDCTNVATSFPNFTELLKQIGLDVHYV